MTETGRVSVPAGWGAYDPVPAGKFRTSGKTGVFLL